MKSTSPRYRVNQIDPISTHIEQHFNFTRKEFARSQAFDLAASKQTVEIIRLSDMACITRYENGKKTMNERSMV